MRHSPRRGVFDERNWHFLRSAYRPVHDPAAPQEAQAETTDRWVRNTKDVPVVRIDHFSVEGMLLGVRQVPDRRRVFTGREMNHCIVRVPIVVGFLGGALVLQLPSYPRGGSLLVGAKTAGAAPPSLRMHCCIEDRSPQGFSCVTSFGLLFRPRPGRRPQFPGTRIPPVTPVPPAASPETRAGFTNTPSVLEREFRCLGAPYGCSNSSELGN
jgi:hypothetical protein